MEGRGDRARKICAYTLPRNRMYGVAIALGIVAGILNAYLDIDFSPRPALFGWLAAAIVTVVIMHEGIHGAAAVLFGHRPLFGLKPPLVYITFTTRIPKGHFMLIALAPLILLNGFFVLLYTKTAFRLFADIAVVINTIGAVGDVWIVLKLLSAPKGALIQDTKTGVEVWV